jgi:galactokinase
MGSDRTVVATAPGRVNLVGDHTDQTGGRVLPMACDLATTVTGEVGGPVVRLRTSWPGTAHAEVEVPIAGSGTAGELPPWGRLVAAVVEELRPAVGLVGTVSTTLPVGAGLSSSAAFTNALALALGWDGDEVGLARLAQRAEQVATGVPCGVMDQLASAAGRAGCALRIDCAELSVRPVPVPDGLDVLVVHSGVERSLAATPYASLVAAFAEAEAVVGPLRAASPADLEPLVGHGDGRLLRRARHVVSENERVDALVAALGRQDRGTIGEVLRASHASLRDDLGASVPAIDALVAELDATPGVLGARVTGAGFGGCVVALADAGTPLPPGRRAWRLRPADGATCAGGGRPSWPGTRRR